MRRSRGRADQDSGSVRYGPYGRRNGTINIDELLYKNKNKKGQTLAYGTLHALCHVVLYPAAKQYVLTYSKQGDVLVWVSYRVAGPPGSGLGLPYRVLPSPIPLIWQWLALNSTF